jgi:hypothetical protein
MKVYTKGMSGLEIQKLKRNLYFLNYLDAHGFTPNYGATLEKAVNKFKKKYNMLPNGRYGEKTKAKIAEHVTARQKLLNKHVSPKILSFGYAGPKTFANAICFKKHVGMMSNAQVGSKTYAKLTKLSAQGLHSGHGSTSSAKGIYTDNFKKEEFECGCGGEWCNGYNGVEMDRRIILVLEDIRAHYGKAVHITSGIRCQRYNDSLSNSIKTSEHRLGRAVDIYISGISAASIIVYLKSIKAKYGLSYFYAITSSAVHLDFQYD